MEAVAQEKGIKETKECLKGIFELAKVSADVLKDGVQVQDLIDGYVKLSSDPEKKAAIEAAIAGVGEVPAELSNIKLVEALELGIFVMQELPALLEAFKPKAV